MSQDAVGLLIGNDRFTSRSELSEHTHTRAHPVAQLQPNLPLGHDAHLNGVFSTFSFCRCSSQISVQFRNVAPRTLESCEAIHCPLLFSFSNYTWNFVFLSSGEDGFLPVGWPLGVKGQ